MRSGSPSPDPVRFPRVAFFAGLALIVAGLFTAATGAQVLVMVTVRGPWAPVPWGLVALGALAVPVGGALTNARAWALPVGLALGGLSVAGNAAWGVFAAINGFVALIPFFSVLLALLAGGLTLAAIGPVRQYAAWQAQLFAPEPSETAQTTGAPQVTPARRTAWPQLVAGAGALSMGGAVVGMIQAPEAAERAWLQLRLLATARPPPSADAFVEAREDYPYPGSPFLEYLDYEARFLSFDHAAASAFADSVAEEVGWRMMVHTGARDVGEAERRLWEAGEGRRVPLWFAAALRAADVFYYPESLLSRSFDPELHGERGSVHLDCDQLAHLFAHVGWRLDLDVREVPSPFHVYLRYGPPEGLSGEALTIEATNFRRIDVSGNRVDFLGEGIGDDYLIPEDYHASGKSGTYADPSLVEAAGLYQPATARDVSDGIVANVVVGLRERGIAAPWTEELRARVEGTRSYVLVSNLHTWTLEDARAALDEGDAARAVTLAESAVALRDRMADLVLVSDPEDRIVLATARFALGEEAGGRAALAEALSWYQAHADPDSPPVALTRPHAEALLLAARVDPPEAAGACEATLGAVLRREEQLDVRYQRWTEEACALAAARPRACAAVLSACDP